MKEVFRPDDILALKNADESTIRVFVRKFTPLALRIGLKYTHNSDDAEDIAQIALIKILNNLEKFRAPLNANAWIFRIVANTCLDFRRNVFRRLRSALSEEMDVGHYFEMPFERENFQRIMKFSEMMPAKMRMIFILHYQEELKMEEIAEVFQISVNTVRVQLMRARQTIRKKLELSGEL